ncbi:MAG: diacylglycerol kinase family protein [Anaerolineales bacterium]
MPKDFFRSRIRSFRYAFEGWWYVLNTQQNAWIHALASVAVVLVSAWLQVSRLEWALIILAIGMVWIAEFINTAIESVVDLVTGDHHPLAKASKDVGAAAVLISALTAIVIGLIVLGPPLWSKLLLLLSL